MYYVCMHLSRAVVDTYVYNFIYIWTYLCIIILVIYMFICIYFYMCINHIYICIHKIWGNISPDLSHFCPY